MMFKLTEGDGFYLLPKEFLFDGLFSCFFERYFEDYLVVFPFFLSVLLGVRPILILLHLLLDTDIHLILRKQ